MHTPGAAQELRDHADEYHKSILQLRASNKILDESTIEGEKEIIGIVTLENVIERILLTDIHDEKDRDTAKKFLRKATIMYRNASQFHRSDDSGTVTEENAIRNKPSIAVDQMLIGSSDGGEVFKSRFVKEYYNELLQDINRTLS